MKILIIMGTRPEVIKLAPVVHEFKKRLINVDICTTGQHNEMLVQALNVFKIKPNIKLDVMVPGQSLNQLTAKLIEILDNVVKDSSPDYIIVQGDTSTAFCAALVAFQRKVKVAHVEAGLRTGDIYNPFPEEAYRTVISKLSSLHFAPTPRAKQILINEGIEASNIYITGNTVVDSYNYAINIESDEQKKLRIEQVCPSALNKNLIIITCHRRENFDHVIENICHMLKRMAYRYKDYHWVFPVHLNPMVQEPVYRILGGISNLSLIPPVDYLTNLALFKHATLAISDSGGIQEEGPSAGIPVVVMRHKSERMEGVWAGLASLAGQDSNSIEREIVKWLEDEEKLKSIKESLNPYGDGYAAKRIADVLEGHNIYEFDNGTCQ